MAKAHARTWIHLDELKALGLSWPPHPALEDEKPDVHGVIDLDAAERQLHALQASARREQDELYAFASRWNAPVDDTTDRREEVASTLLACERALAALSALRDAADTLPRRARPSVAEEKRKPAPPPNRPPPPPVTKPKVPLESRRSALLEEARHAPDDDAPRLALARLLEGEDGARRGELIELQCAIERGGLPRRVAILARRREQTLLAEHGARWADLEGLASEWTFRRGFVEQAKVEARIFLDRGKELRERAPLLQRLDLPRITSAYSEDEDAPLESKEAAAVLDLVRGVVTSPHFEGIPFLGLGLLQVRYRYTGEFSIYDREASLAERAYEVLRQTGALSRLRGLSMDGASRYLLAWLAQVDAHLESIELEGDVHDLLAREKWVTQPGRVWLRDDFAVNAAELSPLLGRVRSLGVVRLPLPEGVAPHLEELAMQATSMSPVAEQLAAEPLTALKTLCIRWSSGGPWVIPPDESAPLFDLEHLAALRVLRFERAVVDQPLLDAFAASPLARSVEVLDLRRSEVAALDTSRFEGLVLR